MPPLTEAVIKYLQLCPPNGYLYNTDITYQGWMSTLEITSGVDMVKVLMGEYCDALMRQCCWFCWCTDAFLLRWACWYTGLLICQRWCVGAQRLCWCTDDEAYCFQAEVLAQQLLVMLQQPHKEGMKTIYDKYSSKVGNLFFGPYIDFRCARFCRLHSASEWASSKIMKNAKWCKLKIMQGQVCWTSTSSRFCKVNIWFWFLLSGLLWSGAQPDSNCNLMEASSS